MSVSQWWFQVDVRARDWLIDNNGDSVPAGIASQIEAVGGIVVVGEPLEDDDVDWIEAVANGEVPDAGSQVRT